MHTALDDAMPFYIHKLLCDKVQAMACCILFAFCGLFTLAIGIDIKQVIAVWCGGISMIISILIALFLMNYHFVARRHELREQQLQAMVPVVVVVNVNMIPAVPRVITQFVPEPFACNFCIEHLPKKSVIWFICFLDMKLFIEYLFIYNNRCLRGCSSL